MAEDFFEALRERASWKSTTGLLHSSEYHLWLKGKQAGINATIEALWEMMVGEPISIVVGKVRMEQYKDVYGLADIYIFSQMATPDGTDGEEVAVLVVRMGKEKQGAEANQG